MMGSIQLKGLAVSVLSRLLPTNKLVICNGTKSLNDSISLRISS